MKDEIIIPVLKEEDFVAATKRRDIYSLKRDLQALEFNSAIATRLLADEKHKVKCEKCGKEFDAGNTPKESLTCPECE
ncbi:MAG: hypothetical protein EPN88_08440 [Bacteroidetes bacterium]|nr:MAG: hypothetical protein EPN88_08440 [Bacteroidota bacterium]